MKIDAFLTCISNLGISTGALSGLEGVYGFNSGLYAPPIDIVYNQLYPNSGHTLSGATGYVLDELANLLLDESGNNIQGEGSNLIIYGPALPLISLGPHVNNGQFQGQNLFKIGYTHSGNFALLMDVQYSGCTKVKGQDYILVSTVDNTQQMTSGFIVGINDANRLFYRTSDYSYTCPKELTTHDFVYVAKISDRYVNFGVFNVPNDTYYGASVTHASTLNSQSIYIGDAPQTSAPYVGFQGTIASAVLFDDGLSDLDIHTCVECMFATGYVILPIPYNFIGSIITGSLYSGYSASTITSYVNVTGQLTQTNNATVPVVIPSGVVSLVTTGEILVPLISPTGMVVNRGVYSFLFDNTSLQAFTNSTIEFDQSLMSGDIVEIYTYPTYNPNVAFRIENFAYPTGTGITQLYCNGLDETSGVDYLIGHNYLSGFNDIDILSYDILGTPSTVLPYSGYWQNSRIPLVTGFYPSGPQFYEDTGNYSGQVLITGLSGISINNIFYPAFGYDVYLNGQHLISGLQYNVITSGTNGFVVLLSGANLPSFYGTILYNNTGGATGVINPDVPELSFIPVNLPLQRTQWNITGTTGILPISGFSEQVWVNGLRMVRGVDYYKHFGCGVSPYAVKPNDFPNIYDSQSDTIGLWNFNFPPTLAITSFNGSRSGTQLTWNIGYSVPSSSMATGYFVDVWLQSSNYNLNFELGYLSTNSTTGSFIISGGPTFDGTVRIRYRNDNIIGPWTYSSTVII